MTRNDNAAAMRAYRQDLRDGIPHDFSSRFLDFAPLEHMIARQGRIIWDLIPTATIYRYREKGVPMDAADRYACELGVHPVEIWPEWFS